MQAILNGTVLAESEAIVRVDGTPYFFREAMKTEFFRDSRLTTAAPSTSEHQSVQLIDGLRQPCNFPLPSTELNRAG